MRGHIFLLSSKFAQRRSKFCAAPFRLHRDCQHSSLSRSPGPLAYYNNLVNLGKLKHDPNQEKVALELDNLLGRLDQYEKDMQEYHDKLTKWEENRENERRKLLIREAEAKQEGGTLSPVKKRQFFFQKWMSRKRDNVESGAGKWVSYLNREKKLDSLIGRRPVAPPAPKGLYIYGNVGSGKTMLMDMFYSVTEGVVQHRRRLHFHEVMLQIHDLMHKIWKKQEVEKSLQSSISNWIMNLPFDTRIKEWLVEEEKYKEEMKTKNILPSVADKFLVDGRGHQRGACVLCFDEIQTVDVFAIIALSGILSRLLSTGTVLVATSNRAPRDLNQDGMQKEIFQELVAKLEEHCENVLIGSEIDYRRHLAQISDDQIHYFWPLDSTHRKEYENAWNTIVRQSGGQVTSSTLEVMFGRTIQVCESCNGAARFTFEYLCGRPIGAADYIAIAKAYHTVFISDIPVMSMRIRDKARRFITLVDELYNHHCQLYCSAAASIDDLFQGTEEGTLFDLESFQFETETENTKLRRDVLTEGKVSTGGTARGIISLLSGQEEMFAFRRAVSRLIEMQTTLYLDGVTQIHPYFQAAEFHAYTKIPTTILQESTYHSSGKDLLCKRTHTGDFHELIFKQMAIMPQPKRYSTSIKEMGAFSPIGNESPSDRIQDNKVSVHLLRCCFCERAHFARDYWEVDPTLCHARRESMMSPQPIEMSMELLEFLNTKGTKKETKQYK